MYNAIYISIFTTSILVKYYFKKVYLVNYSNKQDVPWNDNFGLWQFCRRLFCDD